ncbi:hypothetical protein TWF694_005109 [Orbilia ellipsospora]|uniref:Uncharacterized protein n=1 Tax=Orbilia ellipsospora TaxID=2528407 RepID=A0AAV9WX58_9PEZI
MQVLATLAVALNLAGAALALPQSASVTEANGPAACKTLYTVTSTYAATATTYLTLGKIPLEVPCGGCDIEYTTLWEGTSVDVQATTTIDSSTTRVPICARTQQAGANAAPAAASPTDSASASASASSSDSGDDGAQATPAATSAAADQDN